MTPGRLELYLLSAAEWRRHHLPGKPSKICADPEVRRFVTDALETMTFTAIAEACRKKFGRARAPGRSAIHRYWEALRRQTHRRPKLTATL